ncbi:MAG: penicillin-binding protein activator [Alphaproteobacteria bacterium]
MTRFFTYISLLLLLAGCSGTTQNRDWYSEYGDVQTGVPGQIQTTNRKIIDDGKNHNIAVLLPQSGPNSTISSGIRNGIELSVLQNNLSKLSVSFYDTGLDANNAIKSALSSNPEIIVGPLFGQNANILRIEKDIDTPVISFTSDATALGDGVMTINLMPTNSIEMIIREMVSDKINDFIIISPNTESGKIMAGAAKTASEMYGTTVRGIFYYTESDNEALKKVSETASMNKARISANKRAREILSDILTNETLTNLEKSKLNYELSKLSKIETLGNLPYTGVLFLGNANDSKMIGSFLRYYGVDSKSVRFYGTAMWDNTDIVSDFTMIGSKYAALPQQDARFSTLYEYIYGAAPTRLATFGYDAMNIAIGTIYSNKPNAAYLLDPSGYAGSDGIIRLKPNGDSERGLRIMELNGTGNAQTIKNAPDNFIVPLYNVEQRRVNPAPAMDLQTNGINPLDYISVPDNLRRKYKSKSYGENKSTPAPITENTITIITSNDNTTISNPEYKPVKIESINKTLIDSVEIEE